MTAIRLLALDDAPALATLYRENREFLAPWEPVRNDGLATAAVREIVAVAFGELGLHRVQAGTLPHNAGSQRVLERNGFARIGVAPAYLSIAGRWQDHVLFQVVAGTGSDSA